MIKIECDLTGVDVNQPAIKYGGYDGHVYHVPTRDRTITVEFRVNGSGLLLDTLLAKLDGRRVRLAIEPIGEDGDDRGALAE